EAIFTTRASPIAALTCMHTSAAAYSPRKRSRSMHRQMCVHKTVVAAVAMRRRQSPLRWPVDAPESEGFGPCMQRDRMREVSWDTARHRSMAVYLTSRGHQGEKLCRLRVKRAFCKYIIGERNRGSRYWFDFI